MIPKMYEFTFSVSFSNFDQIYSMVFIKQPGLSQVLKTSVHENQGNIKSHYQT